MTVSTSDFDFVRELLRQRTGIALEADKSYLVDSRLLPVARKHNLSDVTVLIQHIRHQDRGSIAGDVLDALCTNETSWLRDGEPFRVLVDEVVPQLMEARRESRALTLWSAACAMGQEPYSLAMMLEDVLPTQGWTYRIVASDVCGSALSRAEAGLYRQLEINRGLPASLLVRHFERDGANWRISQAMRQRITFQHNNLLHDPPPVTRADVVLLRNVLIYFDIPTRQRVLEKVRNILAPDGVLLLGAAETTLGLSEGWLRTTHGRTTFNRPERSGWLAGSLSPPSNQVSLTQVAQR